MNPTEKTVLIKGGTTVSPRQIKKQDIFIRGQTIAGLGYPLAGRPDTVVDAEGCLVMPGAVDTHVHFNDEFMGTVSVHDFFSGTHAAAFGGVTTIIDFANQAPGISLRQTLDRKKTEAAGKALVDWGIHPVITRADPGTLNEIPLMVEMGAPTIKCYMTYREEGLMMSDPDLRLILEKLRDSGGMLLVHAEDNGIIETNIPAMIRAGKTDAIYHARSRPMEAEVKAVKQVIRLADETGGPLFIVHMSAADGMDLAARATEKGTRVFAETCTHYLVFSEEELRREDGIKWICSPPLRSLENQSRLGEGLRDGRLSMVTSDDAAFSWEAKLMGKERFDKCPNGIPGIEPRLSILYSEGVLKGRISLPRLIDLTATTPAKLFGLWPSKGEIRPGADADLILFNPLTEWTMNRASLHMAADWSAYEGIPVKGRIEKVFSRGEMIVDGDKCLARKGRGRYLHRTLDFLR
jgi:dihydropyrimidinase